MHPLPTVSQAYAYLKQGERAWRRYLTLLDEASLLVKSLAFSSYVRNVIAVTNKEPVPSKFNPNTASNVEGFTKS